MVVEVSPPMDVMRHIIRRDSVSLLGPTEPALSERIPADDGADDDDESHFVGLHVAFVDKEGQEHTFEVAKGDNLLDIAQANDLEMEGACGGSCACSTCHVIVDDQDMYDKVPEPDDEENDMLDLAFGLTETSRLGCQVKMAPELDGMRVRLPSMTRNMQQSDFSKK
ncbi:MAG: mitochondrial matrix iron-sulfur protein [Lichina confinis]|nr:MAG: mitochondrial matrix iron-sulfur protein [Lichina confinis]